MKVNDDFVLRNIYGKHILFPIQKNDISSDPILLNDVAANVWTLINEKNSRCEVLTKISAIYSLKEGSEEIISVDNFLSTMIKMNLIY